MEMNWPPRGRENRTIVNALLTLSEHLSLGESAWHGMMDENRGKSMRDILPKICMCVKEQQYIRNVVHQDLGYKSQIFFGEVGLRVNADADADAETLQTIVVKPPWIDSVATGGFGSIP
ncbi:hypothetical protein ACTXT7_006906 [Hymenolepis weldensis]